MPLGMRYLPSSLVAPKCVPKLEIGILKIGVLITITCNALLILTVYQEIDAGLHWSQSLPIMFVLVLGMGLYQYH
jgi:hypothetical protein